MVISINTPIFATKKTMLQVIIREKDREVFARERYEHIHPRVCQRMNALHLKSKNFSNTQICNILGICENTLLSYYRMYNAGGIEELRKIRQNKLLLYKDSLEKYFTENPPCSILEAASKIKELTGIERKETQVSNFLKSIGFRRLQVDVVPEKAITEEKKTSKRNIWTKNFNLD